MKTIKKLFKIRENNLKEKYQFRVGHNVSDGSYREDLIKAIIDIIPEKYNIKNGFIIDSQGNITKEMDLIIFDEHYVPKFFMETYSMIPIESVVAVIQVKTKLKKSELHSAIENLNSIDSLVPMKGGKIMSANNCEIVEEKRYINPIKILVSGTHQTSEMDDAKNHSTIDIIYIIDNLKNKQNNRKGFLKIRKIKDDELVSQKLDLKEMREKKKNNLEYNTIYNSKLFNFSLSILKYLLKINNSMIINYDSYLKGGKDE